MLDNDGIIPVLARAVREVEAAAQRGPVTPSVRTKFQVVALLMREERARAKADTTSSEASRADELKRLDGIATILAKAAARDTSLLGVLAEDAEVSDSAKSLRRDMLRTAGVEAGPEEVVPADPSVVTAPGERRVVPQSVVSRQLANPFMAPDFSHATPRTSGPRQLATWELLGPLLTSFERATNAATACMKLPEPGSLQAPGGLELMPHQAQLVAAAASGHRTFLLADEPGLGKTAQALLAAEAANAFPLLVVVPNVVKTNWARESGLWTPRRTATVIHGDGHSIDGFADIVIVNYEVLDRHIGWLGAHGFRGMVVDEAHFIKNRSSQRSQHVLQLADKIRSRVTRPLMMALTGTPLINDIEDFKAIWQFLGWIDEKKPLGQLMEELEHIGLTPADPGFYPAARRAVVNRGIVRRRKVDVAADIPARRIADLPVELDDEAGRSIREAERELARRLVSRYENALATRTSGAVVDGIDHELVRRVAVWERDDTTTTKTDENVFSMMRRIGQAKAGLAADYTAQLARNVGKVVFFAKHVDVMDVAEETFARRGIRYSSIRGDQTPKSREKNI
ncbi:MAG: helicase, partial [Marmoricola sp.]|nr:helicase [Marmoricola sp.]